jgi:hypothetical protein
LRFDAAPLRSFKSECTYVDPTTATCGTPAKGNFESELPVIREGGNTPRMTVRAPFIDTTPGNNEGVPIRN